jgi:uncharacterized membrane protein YtjA (UPF0391 family)
MAEHPSASTIEASNQVIRKLEDIIMLGWAITFLVIALIAAALGFGGIAGAATNIAYVVFVVAIILAVIAFLRRAA